MEDVVVVMVGGCRSLAIVYPTAIGGRATDEDALVFIAGEDGGEHAVGRRWMEKMQRLGLSAG